MNNEIIITKLPNGNYEIRAESIYGGRIEFEQAAHIVSKVREHLNYLRLPPEEKKTDESISHNTG